MKLVQLNVWGGRLDHPLKDFLKTENPDILCLQEAIDLDKGRGALFVSVSEMRDIVGAEYYYMSPAFSFNFMQRKAHFGNCIISKLPIMQEETIFTGREYEPNFDWTKHTQNIRNLQHVEIALETGGPLHLFNHHGHHNYVDKDGDDETVRQCNIIAEKIKAVPGRKILAGDFNLVPDSTSLKPINKLLRNLTMEAHVSTTRTILTRRTEPCDYIFTSEGITVRSFTVSDVLISDHQPLILQFD